MSQISQLFVISPIPGDIDNKPEVFVKNGIDCPDCRGVGYHSYYEGKHGSSRDDIVKTDCPRCGGIGKLRAKVVVKWEADSLIVG